MSLCIPLADGEVMLCHMWCTFIVKYVYQPTHSFQMPAFITVDFTRHEVSFLGKLGGYWCIRRRRPGFASPLSGTVSHKLLYTCLSARRWEFVSVQLVNDSCLSENWAGGGAFPFLVTNPNLLCSFCISTIYVYGFCYACQLNLRISVKWNGNSYKMKGCFEILPKEEAGCTFAGSRQLMKCTKKI